LFDVYYTIVSSFLYVFFSSFILWVISNALPLTYWFFSFTWSSLLLKLPTENFRSVIKLLTLRYLCSCYCCFHFFHQLLYLLMTYFSNFI
jgi:hypothetical protein